MNYIKSLGIINISWIPSSELKVEQNYTITFDMNTSTAKTTELYYLFEQDMSDSHIECSAYVTAVNGAGESDPSNSVTIPSLPDIGPVTDSLTHQVWKSDGEIMLNISFEVRYYA